MELMSVVIPVFRNQDSLLELVAGLVCVAEQAVHEYEVELEAIFVVDGSPDESHELLAGLLMKAGLKRARLLEHSRNFGTYAAMRSGMAAGNGDYFCVLAADLQEPPELIIDFLSVLRGKDYDLVTGRRVRREDGFASRVAASLFWRAYRRLLNSDIPKGGVNVFACTRQFRDELLALREADSSLIALAFWLGFRRTDVPYVRRRRPYGRNRWSLRMKLKYLTDSVVPFTGTPIAILTASGAVTLAMTVLLTLALVVGRLAWGVDVPDDMPMILTVMFFGALNLCGLGVIGSYARRAYENTKSRPTAVVRSDISFNPVRDHRD